jgi:hypothetical protein
MTASLPAAWWDWTFDKIQIASWTGFSDDTLHTHAGLLILVLASLVYRRAPWTWRPWLTVLALELLNEAWDLMQPFYPSDEGNIPASLHDLWVTMLWPTVILLLFPLLYRHSAASADQPLGEGANMRADVVAG